MESLINEVKNKVLESKKLFLHTEGQYSYEISMFNLDEICESILVKKTRSELLEILSSPEAEKYCEIADSTLDLNKNLVGYTCRTRPASTTDLINSRQKILRDIIFEKDSNLEYTKAMIAYHLVKQISKLSLEIFSFSEFFVLKSGKAVSKTSSRPNRDEIDCVLFSKSCKDKLEVFKRITLNENYRCHSEITCSDTFNFLCCNYPEDAIEILKNIFGEKHLIQEEYFSCRRYIIERLILSEKISSECVKDYCSDLIRNYCSGYDDETMNLSPERSLAPWVTSFLSEEECFDLIIKTDDCCKSIPARSIHVFSRFVENLTAKISKERLLFLVPILSKHGIADKIYGI